MDYIVLFILALLLVICLCYLCLPGIKEGFTSTGNCPPGCQGGSGGHSHGNDESPNREAVSGGHSHEDSSDSKQRALLPGSLPPSGKASAMPSSGASSHPSKSVDSPGDTPSPDQSGKGTLFLYPEVPGFQIPDFGGFPNPQVVKDNFHTIAIVANHAGDYISQWNDPHVLALKTATNLPVTKWLAYYFGKDSNWACMCNWAGCVSGSMNGQARDCDSCTQAVLTEVTKDIQQHQISGILFDDEVGNPTCIVQAMEQAKDKFPSLQIGWTKSLGNAKQSSPENLGKIQWDVCLGQAYTDNTVDLYNGSCNFAPTFWSSIASKYDSSVPANRGVPMVCGGGNCIMDEDANGKKFCIDERMSGANISKLLKNRPPASQFKWRNFAIWYGVYSGTPFGCTNNNDACQTACCNNWFF